MRCRRRDSNGHRKHQKLVEKPLALRHAFERSYSSLLYGKNIWAPTPFHSCPPHTGIKPTGVFPALPPLTGRPRSSNPPPARFDRSAPSHRYGGSNKLTPLLSVQSIALSSLCPATHSFPFDESPGHSLLSPLGRGGPVRMGFALENDARNGDHASPIPLILALSICQLQGVV